MSSHEHIHPVAKIWGHWSGGGVDVERRVSTKSMAWKRAAVSSKVGRSNSELRGSGRADLVVTFSGSVDPMTIRDGASRSSGNRGCGRLIRR
jgi:hypothetical protein